MTTASFLLSVCFLGSAYLTGAALFSIGARGSSARVLQSAVRAAVVTAAGGALSVGLLLRALAEHDYRYAYVWRFSSNDLPPIYALGALFAGAEGKLLATAVCCSLWTVLLLRAHSTSPPLLAFKAASLGALLMLLFGVVVLIANPFRLHPVEMLDGQGLASSFHSFWLVLSSLVLILGLSASAIPSFSARRPEWFVYLAGCLIALGAVFRAVWLYRMGAGIWTWDGESGALLLALSGALALHRSLQADQCRWTSLTMLCSALAVSSALYALTVIGLSASTELGPEASLIRTVLFVGIAAVWAVHGAAIWRKAPFGPLVSAKARSAGPLAECLGWVALWGVLAWPQLLWPVGPGYFEQLALPGIAVLLFVYVARIVLAGTIGQRVLACGLVIASAAGARSYFGRSERDLVLAENSEHRFGSYLLRVESVKERVSPYFNAAAAEVRVFSAEAGEVISLLRPELRFYHPRERRHPVSAVCTTLLGDLLVTVLGVEQGGAKTRDTALLRIVYSPWQLWVWLGCALAGFGVMLLPFERGRSDGS